MGQSDLFEYLRQKRLSGDHRYFSISQVYRELLDMKKADAVSRNTLWGQIRKLERYGYLEVKGIGGWPSYFRVREECLKKKED